MSKKKGKILIVDDNEEFLLGMRMFLNPHFELVKTEKNPNQIMPWLNRESFDVILLDMNFSAGVNSGNEGIFWMNQILKKDPDAVIVFITAYGEIELAVNAIQSGATDFIEKAQDEEQILATIIKGYQKRIAQQKIQNLQAKQLHLSQSIHQDFQMVKGTSSTMQKILKTIDKVAKTEANILILGESGTGKEVIAREIHNRSDRSEDVFVTVDLAAISESLFESELFGYVKGAFTDAREDKTGRFEIASGGTLFLDEIGNLPLSMQAKILTVLQNRQLIRLGATTPVSLDLRMISATNMPLAQMLPKGEFREDLLYRINTIQIELPPLRQRKEDIPVLADYFLSKYQQKYNKPEMNIHPEALTKLKGYDWPGNIRELQHTLEKAVILSESSQLKADDFRFQAVHSRKLNQPNSYNLEDNEKRLVQEAMDAFAGNLTEVARQLGITRSTLYKKIEKYDLK